MFPGTAVKSPCRFSRNYFLKITSRWQSLEDSPKACVQLLHTC